MLLNFVHWAHLLWCFNTIFILFFFFFALYRNCQDLADFLSLRLVFVALTVTNSLNLTFWVSVVNSYKVFFGTIFLSSPLDMLRNFYFSVFFRFFFLCFFFSPFTYLQWIITLGEFLVKNEVFYNNHNPFFLLLWFEL